VKSTSSYYIDPCRANIVPIWQIGDLKRERAWYRSR
jgi:hypothetical protein